MNQNSPAWNQLSSVYNCHRRMWCNLKSWGKNSTCFLSCTFVNKSYYATIYDHLPEWGLKFESCTVFKWSKRHEKVTYVYGSIDGQICILWKDEWHLKVSASWWCVPPVTPDNRGRYPHPHFESSLAQKLIRDLPVLGLTLLWPMPQISHGDL